MQRIIKPSKESNSQGWGEVSNAEIPGTDIEKGTRAAQALGITEVLQGHVRHEEPIPHVEPCCACTKAQRRQFCPSGGLEVN